MSTTETVKQGSQESREESKKAPRILEGVVQEMGLDKVMSPGEKAAGKSMGRAEHCELSQLRNCEAGQWGASAGPWLELRVFISQKLANATKIRTSLRVS